MKKITRSDGTLRMLLRMTWKLYRRQMILTLVVTLLGQTAEFLTGTYMLGFTVNALREQRPVSGIFSFLLLASLVTRRRRHGQNAVRAPHKACARPAQLGQARQNAA